MLRALLRMSYEQRQQRALPGMQGVVECHSPSSGTIPVSWLWTCSNSSCPDHANVCAHFSGETGAHITTNSLSSVTRFAWATAFDCCYPHIIHPNRSCSPIGHFFHHFINNNINNNNNIHSNCSHIPFISVHFAR